MQTEWHVPFNVCLSVSINYLVVDLDHYNNNSYDRLRAVSLFLHIWWGECTRARASSETRETRTAAREEKRETLFSCLSRLAPQVTRVVICVSRAFCLTDQEKRETSRSLLLWKIKRQTDPCQNDQLVCLFIVHLRSTPAAHRCKAAQKPKLNSIVFIEEWMAIRL